MQREKFREVIIRRKVMVKSLNNEKELNRMLNIGSFRNLSKDKIMNFVSEIPKMDKEVAMNI